MSKKNIITIKKEGTKSSTSSSSSLLLVDTDGDFIKINCIFQARITSSGSGSENLTPSRILLTNSLLKSLKLRLGSFIQISFNNKQDDSSFSPSFLARVFPYKKSSTILNTEVAVLSKLWSNNSNKEKKVFLKNANQANLINCTRIILKVDEKYLESIKSFPIFRSYLHEQILDCGLQEGLDIELTLKGLILKLKISSLLNDTMKSNNNDKLFYLITPDTVIEIIGENNNNDDIETLPSSTSLYTSNSSKSLTNFNNLFQYNNEDLNNYLLSKIQNSFYGYKSQILTILGLINLGMGLIKLNSTTNDTPKHNEILSSNSTSLFRLPRGLIIHGPSGCGKTELVESIVKAYGIHSIYISHKILMSTYQGEAEGKLREFFLQAKLSSPCFIIIENLHLLAPSRTSTTCTELQKRIVSCLLTLMDELHNVKEVFLLATTTSINNIDSAIKRNGRIDSNIDLSILNYNERKNIFYFLFQKYNINILQNKNFILDNNNKKILLLKGSKFYIKNKNLKKVLNNLYGMLPSDLVQIIKEAVLQVVSKSNSSVETNNLESNLDDLITDLSSLDLNSSKFEEETSDNEEIDSILSSNLVDVSSDLFKNYQEITYDDLIKAIQRVPPSSLKEIIIEIPKVRWNDIGGMNEIKNSLKQIIEWPIKYSKLFSSINLTPLKGLLLYGPPGCSKTLMAKAIATESSMNFLAVKGPELLSKWLGESEKAVQNLFARARSVAPSIIFFDEIDALAGTRGESSAGVSDRVLSQLLTELDGINNLEQVIIVAATNRPDMLDPALVRPGRIDRKVYVPPPDYCSRLSIIELELNKLPHEELKEEEIETLIRLTEGFSGAEIVSIVTDAALKALEMDEEKIKFNYLLDTVKEIKPQITSEMIKFYKDYESKNKV